MKVAFCYSGHIGKVKDCAPTHPKKLAISDYDVFAHTSDLITQRINRKVKNPKPYFKVDPKKVKVYLPGGEGWRKNAGPYGIIYKIGDKKVEDILNQTFGDHLKSKVIEIEGYNTNAPCETKWEWLRKNQLRRAYECHNLMEKYALENNVKYDIVVRSRFDVALISKLKIDDYFKQYNGHKSDRIFVIGGWKNKKFMNRFLFDGFMFGNPKVMSRMSELYNKIKPYKHDKTYSSYHKKYGASSEYQVQQHIEKSGIEPIYVFNNQRAFKVLR